MPKAAAHKCYEGSTKGLRVYKSVESVVYVRMCIAILDSVYYNYTVPVCHLHNSFYIDKRSLKINLNTAAIATNTSRQDVKSLCL